MASKTPEPQIITPEEAYKIVLDNERANLQKAMDELTALRGAVTNPLGDLMNQLPQFAGPRSAAITKLRGFAMSLANWGGQIDQMILELQREIVKYDRIDPNVPIVARGG